MSTEMKSTLKTKTYIGIYYGNEKLSLFENIDRQIFYKNEKQINTTEMKANFIFYMKMANFFMDVPFFTEMISKLDIKI